MEQQISRTQRRRQRCSNPAIMQQTQSWPVNSSAAVATLLLMCLVPSAWGAHVRVSKPMRDHIRQFVSQIPVHKDYLGEMTDSQRISWSGDLGYSVNETLKALTEVKLKIRVDVKLVGFAGDGNEALLTPEHNLQMYLRGLHSELDTVALNPAVAHMAVNPDISFRVQPAYYELATKVSAAINQGVNTGQSTNLFGPFQLHLIPYQNVDKLIQEDFDHSDGTYTIYLLNPAAHAPYAYSYHDGGNATDSCPGSLWVSHKRYAWLDLSANLTFYGPGPGGRGQVFTHSVPVVKHYKKDVVSKAILPDLAALVWSACEHLIWPPLYHGKLSYNRQLEVHLIYMVEALMRPSPAMAGRVDVAALQEQLQTVAKPLKQQVSVTEHFLLFSECDHCVAAYSGALKARTSRSAGEKGFHLSMSQYLDLTEMEKWLKDWRDVLLSEAGINWDTEHGGAAILPVFVFDVPTKEPVLLDGVLQASVLGSGDVVAIRTAGEPFATFFGCFDTHMALNPKQIHRPVLAATLQAAYGVAETAVSWSQATGKTWSFLWSVGQTPFGALSNQATVSFAQRDAALRNMALAYLNSSMNHAAMLIKGFEFLAPDGHLEQVKSYLQPDQVIPYNQRTALLLFKIREAAAALASQQHALAVGYAASTVQDVAALHKITRQYKSTLDPDLICAGRDEQRRWWLLPMLCTFVTVVLIVWRCARGADDDGDKFGSSSKRGSLGGASFGSSGYGRGF
eukprot:GHRR01007663.1.p1 GENE.GHRR01007663.1~~GHRR01007663.1.p1  ORF type:complete len:735 (+),score=144.94 GHRR01007663.1:731-2935(+)